MIYRLAILTGGLLGVLSKLWWVVLIASIFWTPLFIVALLLLLINAVAADKHTPIHYQTIEPPEANNNYRPRGWRND